MTRVRRGLLALGIVLAVFAAIGVAVVLRRHAPPEPVRLLPESDAAVFVNLKNIRRLTSFSSQPIAGRSPDYEQFVRETGFEFERDLDEAAFAVHIGLAQGQNRYSEVLVGRYDSQKLSAYLRKIARSVETYRQLEIYSVPIEDRIVRVAPLAIDTVAISNVSDASVIHGMIDRYKEAALPFGGPTIVQQYYKDVPFGSVMWAVGHIPSSPDNPRKARALTLPGGFDISVPAGSDAVASVRVLTAIHAKAEFITPSEEDARQFTEQTGTLLNLFHTLEANTKLGGSDTDVKAVFDSLSVEQKKKSATISAEIPIGFLHKLFADTPAAVAPEAAPATPPQASPKPGARGVKPKKH